MYERLVYLFVIVALIIVLVVFWKIPMLGERRK